MKSVGADLLQCALPVNQAAGFEFRRFSVSKLSKTMYGSWCMGTDAMPVPGQITFYILISDQIEQMFVGFISLTLDSIRCVLAERRRQFAEGISDSGSDMTAIASATSEAGAISFKNHHLSASARKR
jgi:hypothetical protein